MANNRKKIKAMIAAGCISFATFTTYTDAAEIKNLNLNNVVIEDNRVTLPNAIIKGDEPINGMKLYFSTGFGKAKPEISYIFKGKTYTTKEQQIHINEVLTPEEASNIIKSIVITRENDSSFQFSVRLNSNETNAEDVVFNPQNGHYYKFIRASNMNWDVAKREAENQVYKGTKGYLVTITSADELDFFNSITPKSVWLGLTDEGSEGKWEWVTGEKYDYTNWAPGEPNDNGGNEDYVQSLPGSNGLWNDLPITGSALKPVEGYIAEFPVKSGDVEAVGEEETITVDSKGPEITEPIKDITVIKGEPITIPDIKFAKDDINGNIPVTVSFETPSGKEADKLDTDIIGKWQVIYTAEDKNNNVSKQAITVDIVGPPETITINNNIINDNVNLNWNLINDVNEYVIYRKVKGEENFTELKNTTENIFNDTTAKDNNSPKVPAINLDTTKDLNSDIKKITLKTEDIGTTYEYKIDGNNNSGITTNTSYIRDINVESGLAGYKYKITNDTNVDLSKEPLVTNDEIILNQNDNNTNLHVCAVDKAGNQSKEFIYPILFAVQPEVKPVEPTEPAQPEVKPVEPTEPTEPVQPEVQPVEPTEPVQPEVKPVDPMEPVQPEVKPVEPTEPVKPEVKPVEPTEPAQPEVKPVEPIEPTQPEVKPVDPVEPVQPEVKPVEPTEPVQPEVKPVEPTEPVQPEVKPVEPTEPVQPEVKPVEPTKPVQPEVKPVEPTKPVQPEVKPVEPTEPVQPEVKPVEPTVPVQPEVKPVEPTKPVQPEVKPVEPTQPEVKPVDPVEPVQPEVQPVEPIEPVKPEVQPVEPTEPVQPEVKPVDPMEPVQPEVKPVEPTEPIQPEVKPVEPTQPEVKPVEPIEPVQPEVKPVEPTEPVQPEVKPVEPTEPVQPEEKPVEPTEPVQPEEKPVEPTEPIQPEVNPVEPTEPIQPEVKPVEPTEPVQPEVKPVEPTEPVQPEIKPVDPMEPVQPEVKPVEPIEPVQPEVKPVEPTQPEVKPVEPIEPVQPEVKPVEPTEPAQPEVKPVEPIEPVKPEVQPVEPTEPVQPEVKPVEPTEPVQPEVKPVEPTKPVQPEVKPVEPTEPVQPEVKPVEPTVPVQPEVQPVDPTETVQPEVKAVEPTEPVQPEVKPVEPIEPVQLEVKPVEPTELEVQPKVKLVGLTKPVKPEAKSDVVPVMKSNDKNENKDVNNNKLVDANVGIDKEPKEENREKIVDSQLPSEGENGETKEKKYSDEKRVSLAKKIAVGTAGTSLAFLSFIFAYLKLNKKLLFVIEDKDRTIILETNKKKFNDIKELFEPKSEFDNIDSKEDGQVKFKVVTGELTKEEDKEIREDVDCEVLNNILSDNNSISLKIKRDIKSSSIELKNTRIDDVSSIKISKDEKVMMKCSMKNVDIRFKVISILSK